MTEPFYGFLRINIVNDKCFSQTSSSCVFLVVYFNFFHRLFPGTAFDFCQNTGPFNVTGHPALSINAGFCDGLPVGMMIVGRKFDEATVLNVAYAYEKIRDAKE